MSSVSQSRLEIVSSPTNSASPRRPSRLYAWSPRPTPARDHSSVPSTPKARSAFGKNDSSIRPQASPSPGAWRLELLGVRVGGSQQEGALAVREERRGRQLGVQVLEPASRELLAQLRVRSPADPERVPGAEDVVEISGLGDLGRPDRASELVLALEDADTPTAAREQGRARERVDAAADDDGVERPPRGHVSTAVHSISIRQPGTASPVMPTIVWAG